MFKIKRNCYNCFILLSFIKRLKLKCLILILLMIINNIYMIVLYSFVCKLLSEYNV